LWKAALLHDFHACLESLLQFIAAAKPALLPNTCFTFKGTNHQCSVMPNVQGASSYNIMQTAGAAGRAGRQHLPGKLNAVVPPSKPEEVST
jgi:hypothetical protein